MIEPNLLLKNGIKLHKIVQKPREYVICRPQAYHSGFNAGYNIAEAVNFALEPWLELAKKGITHCRCQRDKRPTVQIDIAEFLQNMNRPSLNLLNITGDSSKVSIKITSSM